MAKAVAPPDDTPGGESPHRRAEAWAVALVAALLLLAIAGLIVFAAS